MDFYNSKDVVASLGDKAEAKTKIPFIRLSILGIIGGSFIALGYLSYIRVSGTLPQEWGSFAALLGGCLFPIGLVALTFVGGELATGNMMVMALGVLQKKVNMKHLAYNWLVILVTNCIGGFLVAYFFGHIVGLTEGAFMEKTIVVAQGKVADTPFVAIVSGIGCNIFVCMAVYLGAMGKTYLGKMFGLWFPVMVFVVCGFQHVVANAFIIPAAIFTNASTIQWTQYLSNTFFVFIGNAIGGSLFLAVPLMFINYQEKEIKEQSGVYERY